MPRKDPKERRIYHKTWRIKNPLKRLIQSSKLRAKLKNLEHTITIDDLNIPLYCPYTGLELKNPGGKRTMNSPSIDRIDNTKGYIKGNVEIISFLGNIMKCNADIKTLQTFALTILKRYPI